MSRLKTTILLATLTGLLLFVGRALGGHDGMFIAFIFALLMNGGAYWFSDTLALHMAGAREVSPVEAPMLHRLVAQLAKRAQIPMPRVYIVESQAQCLCHRPQSCTRCRGGDDRPPAHP